MIDLRIGDCITKMKEMEENSVDFILCDPPYELNFMSKRWDNTGIAFNSDMWKEALRVLKPGGYLMAFSGTRTYHRMAVAIEDAGFEVKDMIEWVYGSGFPKALDISKQLEKKGELELVKQYEGYKSSLKPAHEPCILAQKNFNFVLNSDIMLKINNILEVITECVKLYVKGAENQSNQHLIEYQEGINTVPESVDKVLREELSEKTGMSKSQETVKTSWNIDTLWNNILEEVFINGSIYTIKTESNLTTDLRTLKSQLLTDILVNITQNQGLKANGLNVDVMNAENLLKEERKKLIDTLNAIVPESVMKQIEQDCLKRLVNFVEENLNIMTQIKNSVVKTATRNGEKENLQTELLGNANIAEKSLKQLNQDQLNIAIENVCQKDIKRASHEPLCLAMKPLSEKNFAENVMKWGTGGLNIDGCRIGSEKRTYTGACSSNNFIGGGLDDERGKDLIFEVEGRFPANLIISENIAPVLDSQSGYSKSSDAIRRNNQSKHTGSKNGAYCYGKFNDCDTRGYSDEGGASRFFKNIEEDKNYTPFIYHTKASKKNRNININGEQIKGEANRSGNYNFNKTGSGNIRDVKNVNNHTTVKPTGLMKYLLKMGLPPIHNAVVLDMFAGSGSTGVALEMLNKEEGTNHKCILIEKEEEYAEIIKKRCCL